LRRLLDVQESRSKDSVRASGAESAFYMQPGTYSAEGVGWRHRSNSGAVRRRA